MLILQIIMGVLSLLLVLGGVKMTYVKKGIRRSWGEFTEVHAKFSVSFIGGCYALC